MSAGLTDTERRVFYQLIESSRMLHRTCVLAGETLSDDFKSMIAGPAAAVETVLAQCPSIDTPMWDGEYSDDDTEVEYFTPDLPDELRATRLSAGVRLKHRPTGQQVEVSTSAHQEENLRRAQRALRDRVTRIGRGQREDPLR